MQKLALTQTAGDVGPGADGGVLDGRKVGPLRQVGLAWCVERIDLLVPTQALQSVAGLGPRPTIVDQQGRA